MNDINLFLTHAIQLEKDSARHYEDLAAGMKTLGDPEVAEFFSQMAHFSRLHLAEAMARGGFHELPQLRDEEYQWPDGTSPEAAAWTGVDSFMDVPSALALALDGEQRACAFYRSIAEQSTDPTVRAMAMEFTEEESDHVRQLEHWIARQARKS